MRLGLFIALAALVFLPPNLAEADRTFDWAIVDYLDITTNPFWVQSCLDLTQDGEPVRAHLLQSRRLSGLHYMGDFQVAHYSAGGGLLWSTVLEGKVHVEDLHVDSMGAIVMHGIYIDSLYVDAENMLLDDSGSAREYILMLSAAREVEYLIDLDSIQPDIYGVQVITVDPNDQVWLGVALNGNQTEIWRLDASGVVAESYIQPRASALTGLSVETDGTVWAAGFCTSEPIDFNGYEQTCPFTYAFYLVKYAPGGMAEWAQFFEDITFQAPHLLSDGYGNVYMAGELHGVFDFGGLFPEGIDWFHDFFLCKVDSSGNFLWLREVPADDFLGDGAMGKSGYLACRGDSLIYFAGFSRGSVDWVGDGNPPPSWDGNDVLVLEYTSDGECRWAKTAGSDWHDIADAIGVDDAGNIFIAGSVHEGAVFDDLEFGGNFINTFIASLPAEDLSAVPEPSAVAGLALRNHPNPFKPGTQIHFCLAEPGPVRLTVHDLRGACVATLVEGQSRTGEHAVVWNGRDADGRSMPSGIYLCRLETALGVTSHRLVMLR